MNIDKFYSDSIAIRKLRKVLAKELKEAGIGYGEFEVLYLLNNGKSYQPTQISKLLSQSLPTISRVLKILDDKKLISYLNDIEDRRTVSVHLTSKGKSKIKSFIKLKIFTSNL